MAAITTSRALIRAYRLQFPSMIVQGALGEWVRRNISWAASSYKSHFSRFLQSSSCNFHRFGVILAGLEPLELFVLVDVYPKLHDNRSKMPEVILHLVDFVVSLLPIGLPAKTFHPLDQDTPIPRTVENGNVTGFRELRPETPKVMMSLFHVIGSGYWDHFVSPRVHSFGQPPDVPSLSRSIHPS